MSTAEQELRRVTVISPVGQHRVDLPVDVPVSRFLPDLLTMAGLHPHPAAGADGWQLADADGKVLRPDSTLAGHGIKPGAVIQLHGGPATAEDRPRPARVPAVPAVPPLMAPVRRSASEPGARPAGKGAIFARDKVQVPRHVPRTAVSTGQPTDSLTPLERAEDVMPSHVGQAGRLASAMGAFFSPAPRQPAHAAPPEPPSLQAGGRLLPSELTLATAPTRLERARSRWRELDHLGQLDALITEPRLVHCATIAVVSPKGGVGKTTTTALLGTLLSLLRRDPIVAVDTNPDFGSLGRVLTPDQSWYVDDLARLVTEDDELSLTALDSHLGRAVHGLLVVPAPTDPARMARLDEESYGRVITRLKDFFSLILLDCGTGLQDPASAAAIAAADQVVLLTDAQPATASLVAESTELLHQWGRPITVVVNRMPTKGARLDIRQLSRYLPAARGLVVIPDDVVAASRLAVGSFDWRDAPASWQLALRRLAVVLVADWYRLGLAR